MKIVAIIQARMSSSRLPGKVLKKICGQSVLGHVVERVRLCSLLDQIVIATTTGEEDDAIVEEAHRLKTTVYRGSRDHVLSRYYYAAKESQADIVVRITSDCPLFDPLVLTELIGTYLKLNSGEAAVDYISNTLKRSYPRGLDCEVFCFSALEKAFHEAKKEYEQEHVTPYIYQHPEIFRIEQMTNGCAEHINYRWTLDTEEDFHFIESVYLALWQANYPFQSLDIYRLIGRNPYLLEINCHIQQKKLGE